MEGAGITERQSPFTPSASESRQKTRKPFRRWSAFLKLHAQHAPLPKAIDIESATGEIISDWIFGSATG